MEEPLEPRSAPADLAADVKKWLRAELLRRRAAPDAAEHARRSAAICAHALALPEVAAARTVHVYWPLLDRREIDTRPLIAALWARGARVVAPVVAQRRPPLLRHVALRSEADLRPGAWGLLEPAGDEVDPATLDVVVVPGLGFDRAGYRVGYGGGYYDAFLAGLAGPTVGLAFDACLAEALPREPHDVPVRIVVTESGAFRPGPPPA